MSLTLATWNVNSVKARIAHLLDWLKKDQPDIVLLQETKCTDDAFPRMEIEDLGYNLALFGEKSYNGVAIFSKFPLDDVRRGLPGGSEDTQARYIEALVSLPSQLTVDSYQLTEKKSVNCQLSTDNCVLRIASVYVPNGQDASSDKFQYKLKFLDRLHTHMQTLLAYDEMLAVGGDYNIAPEDADVHDPKAWEGSVLTHEEVRKRLRSIFHLGMYDAYRLKFPLPPCGGGLGRGISLDALPPPPRPSPIKGEGEENYTWWDYRNNAFAKDDGLRIDHFLLSPQAADHISGFRVEKNIRALDKASDHAPVIIHLNI